MAACKGKKAKQNKTPKGNRISQKKTPSEGKYLTDNGNPDHYYDEKPAFFIIVLPVRCKSGTYPYPI